MDILTVVLWIGLLWIVGVTLWSWTRPIEPFVTPTWIRTHLDRVARKEHSCQVLETLSDPEVPGAVIEIVESTCEEGLPHTSGPNTIRIPKTFWEGADSIRRKGVLRHERIHLLQRRNPEAWLKFYKEWNYTLHNKPPAEYPDANTVRGNPDTDPPFACWAGRYWFFPLYSNTVTPTLKYAETEVWDAHTHRTIDPPEQWRAFFCQEGKCPHQWEHPAEIAAEYWTDIEHWKTPASVLLRNFILNL
jgi:hypothetical protein